MKRCSALLYFMFAILFALFLSCSDDEQPPKPNTIVDVARANGFNVLVAAIEQEGLEDELNTIGPFTLLAPTDDAFQSNYGINLNNISEWKNTLRKLVLSHVLPDNIRKEDFSNGFYETLNGNYIEVDLNFGMIGCGNLGSPHNIIATNGIVHKKMCVEFLISSLIVTIGNSSSYTNFNDLLTRFPNVIAVLSENKLHTVFPPTNAAFAAFFQQNGYSSVYDIPADLAEQILRYHIVPDVRLKSIDFINNQLLATAVSSDKKLSITISSDVVKVNGANIVEKNIQAEKSMIHVIDQVLVP